MERKPGYIFVIVMTFIVTMVAVGINMLNTFQDQVEDFWPKWFYRTVANVSDMYYVEITPAGWAFSIWGLIYIYQFLFLIYGLSTICRKTHDWGGYLYYRPPFMPILLYVMYIVNMVLNVTWIFMWDRLWLTAASPVLFAVSFTLYICIGLSMHALYNNGPALLRLGHGREVALVRGLVHNGLGMYAAWTSIASLLNLAMTLTYVAGLAQKDASTIALGILAVEIIGYSAIDNFLLDKYSRYMFTPYLVPIWALVGSIYKNWVLGERNSTISAVLLGLAGFALVLKVSMVIVRGRRDGDPLDRRGRAQ